MYGELGNKLVLLAKRTLDLSYLPPYSTEYVRAITREVRDLDAHVSNLQDPFGDGFNPKSEPAAACAMLVNHVSIRRNKRCLLVYHRTRIDKVEEFAWRGQEAADVATGTNEEGALEPATTSSSSLSPQEEDYVRQYGDLLAALKGTWTDVDLTSSLEPPRDLFVDVRVLKDAGEIQTEYGIIALTKDSQFFVRQGDVERLISKGYLQKLV